MSNKILILVLITVLGVGIFLYITLKGHTSTPTQPGEKDIPSTFGASVIPNKAIITGKVFKYSILNTRLLEPPVKPEMIYYSLVILVFSTEDIPGWPNAMGRTVGKYIEVFTTDKLSPELFGKTIKGVVTLRGDERLTRYFIWGDSIEVIEEEK